MNNTTENKAGYTPGPWRIGTLQPDSEDCDCIRYQQQIFLGKLGTTEALVMGAPIMKWTDEDRANVALIARAPQLLEENIALKIRTDELEAALKRIQSLNDRVNNGVNEMERVSADAYNAINNAMQTLLACDHVSMLRHPQIVDGLHQALNGLKRFLAKEQPEGK